MAFDDPSNFLFGLNQFASPPADSPSGSGGGGLNNGGRDAGSSLLHDLNNFDTGSAAPGMADDGLQMGGTFADQLALWTNANFSFDGPTGHALLAEDDKDKAEKDNVPQGNGDRDAGQIADNADRRRAQARAAGRDVDPRDERRQDDPTHREHRDHAMLQQQANYFAPPSAKAEEARRPGYAAPGANGARDAPPANAQQQQPAMGPATPALSPAQIAQVQQQQAQFAAQLQAQLAQNGAHQGSPLWGGAPGAANSFQALLYQQQQQTAQAAQHQQGFGGIDLAGALALQQLIANNPLALASLGNLGQLAQLGPLANAFNNPSTSPTLRFQPAAPLTAQQPNPLQPQQQQQQPQQQQQGVAPQGAFGGAPWPYGAPGFNMNPFGVAAPLIASPTPTTGEGATPGPTTAPTPSFIAALNNAATAPEPDTSNEAAASSSRRDSKKKKVTRNGTGTATAAHSRSNSFSRSDEAGASSGSGRGDASMRDSPPYDASETAEERARAAADRLAAREEIPPLKLIDTGNPEADAEANKAAIEEDKRRRNTAASARFRIKKKQREAALEATTRDLRNRVSDLEAENSRLRTENGWLKGLIHVKPEPGASGTNGAGPSGTTGPQAAAAAAVAAAAAARAGVQWPGPNGSLSLVAPQPPSTGPRPPVPAFNEGAQGSAALPKVNGTGAAAADAAAPRNGPVVPRTRDSGLLPRGVGTDKDAEAGNTAAGHKRDRED